jgi:hypothetical protein
MKVADAKRGQMESGKGCKLQHYPALCIDSFLWELKILMATT